MFTYTSNFMRSELTMFYQINVINRQEDWGRMSNVCIDYRLHGHSVNNDLKKEWLIRHRD